MPYRGGPSTDVNDEIRLLIGDTSTSTGGEVFTDAEIDYFAALKPNAHLAASAAVKSSIGSGRADSLAEVIRKQVGDLSLDRGGGESTSQVLQNKASALRMEGVRKVTPYAGGTSKSDKRTQEQDSDRNPPSFRIGQYDHPGISTGENEYYNEYQ